MRKRTFEDVQLRIRAMTGVKPMRCPDNIDITKRTIKALGLSPVLETLRFIHIAGTKGKGSTAVYTSALLNARGLRVGTFVSPHLTDVRERMLINNRVIPKQAFADYFFEMDDRHDMLNVSESQNEREIASRANFFRFMFCLALHIFEKEKVDIAVMEVGIGGRLDATNIINPVACGITALGMDHMEILGDTIELIAAEKGGIIKPNVPCFSNPQVEYPTTIGVLDDCARNAKSGVVYVDEVTLPVLRSLPPLAIGGRHMLDNVRLAVALSRFASEFPMTAPLQKMETDCLVGVTFQGRSQIVAPANSTTRYYLDGAHTPESIRVASEWFFSEAKRSEEGCLNIIVFYSSRDPQTLMPSFAPYVADIAGIVLANVLDPKIMPTGAAPGKEIVESAATACAAMFPSVPRLAAVLPFTALQQFEAIALKDIQGQNVNVFVTGSFFLVGDFLKMLGQGPPEGEEEEEESTS